jgi:hypothetical protein
MADEEWRPVVGYEGLYEVSSFGRVRSLDRHERVSLPSGAEYVRRRRGRLLVIPPDHDGYAHAKLSRDGVVSGHGVHALVCAAFHGPRPEGKQAAHNDGRKGNNAASNLRWATPTENSADMLSHGTVLNGQRNHLARLSEAQVIEIRRKLTTAGPTQIAREYGVTPECIMAIRSGRTWKHLL